MSKKTKILAIFTILLVFFVTGPYIAVEIITDRDGIWNPEPNYQRYRVDEYPTDKPFFQWWYFSLKDYLDNRSFAFTYSMSRPTSNLTYIGTYMMFAMVSQENHFHIYNNYSLNKFDVKNDFDVDIGNSQFNIDIIDDDTYRISGSQDHNAIWVSEGISPESNYSWNLDIHRISGWYGQQDIEFMTRFLSLISWNTYSYDSEVNGTITINSTTYEINRTERFRMYCDMNWGENFPNGEPDIDYPWGWYYTGVPTSNPDLDFSIIAGVGRSDTSIAVAGAWNAKFASMYIHGEKISARKGKIWDFNDDRGLTMLSQASDGKCSEFTVERSNWQSFTDIFGIALIPMTQIVTIETSTKKIIMTYDSKPENYNRLIFPTDGYLFSDFEGLGVKCTTEIYNKTYSSWDLMKIFPAYNLSETLIDYNAGVEYGYRLEFYI